MLAIAPKKGGKEQKMVKQRIKKGAAKIEAVKIKEIEDSIRDIINLIKVKNEEEVEGGFKKIEDDAAEELIERLREIAQKLSLAAI